MELKDIVAKNLVELRRIFAYTQVEIAEKLNYSDKAISKWERGESLPDVETLKKIADIYGVTVDFLLTENNDIKKSMGKKKGLIAGQKTLIALLSALIVWMVATITFAILCWCGLSVQDASYSFIVAIPVSFIVFIVFSSLWGKPWLNLVFVSALMWTIALGVYLLIKTPLAWLCFIVPIPLQVAALLWYGLKILNIYLKKKKPKTDEKEIKKPPIG